MHQLHEITQDQSQSNLARANSSIFMQHSMAIATDVVKMAILQATARPISKSNKVKPQKTLLLESLAYNPFLESPRLYIWLKLG